LSMDTARCRHRRCNFRSGARYSIMTARGRCRSRGPKPF
jgi:hypothetical protein